MLDCRETCSRRMQEINSNSMRRPIITLVVAGIIILAAITTPAAPPAQGREVAVYRVRWSFVVAGMVEIAIEQPTMQNGEKAGHFSLTASTLPFFDVFHKVRDRLDSYTDAAMTHSLLYTKVQQGKNKRDITVLFDWRTGKGYYQNRKERVNTVALDPGTFDPLAAYFFFRRLDFQVGDVVVRPVSDGKKLVQGKATVLARQKISVPAGNYDTFLVEPDMQEVRGVFEKSKDARLLVWLSADSNHLLIKAESKVALGSIVAELVSYSPPGNP